MAITFKYRLATFILRAISVTWRYKIVGQKSKSPAIIAFWHGQMLPVWKYFAKDKPYAVVSQSKDGTVLTHLLECWGYHVLRGSSSKGSKEVLAGMVSSAGKSYLLITPDGPRGPINEFKAGAAVVSQRSGVPFQLCGVRMNHAIIFSKSWDKFQLPLPFSTIDLSFSEPIFIKSDATRDEVSAIISQAQKKLIKLSGIE